MAAILALIEAIAGPIENLVALHIHNPKSQQIEATVVTDANTVLGVAAAICGAKTTASSTTTTA